MKYKDKLEYMRFLKNLKVDILAGMMTETNTFYTSKGITNDQLVLGINKARSEYFDNIISPLNLKHTDEMEKTLLIVSCTSAIFSYLYLKNTINIDYEYFECPYVNYWHLAKDTAKFCNNYCIAMNYLFENEFDLDLCISYELERVITDVKTVVYHPNYHIRKRSEMSQEEIFIYEQGMRYLL